jgi:hypothetical protein
MAEKERDIIKERLLNLEENERLFRINAGLAWTANKKDKFFVSKSMTVRVNKGDLILRRFRPFHGAPEGWGDLAGWTEIEITSDMIGKKFAIFTMEEIKATGKLSAKQNKFKEIVLRMGGFFRVLKF